MPQSLWAPKGNPSAPQTHSFRSPTRAATVTRCYLRKARFLEIYLARLSSSLSFSGSWHQALFVFRHFTAVCHHLPFSGFEMDLRSIVAQTIWHFKPDIWKKCKLYLKRKYLPAWRGFWVQLRNKSQDKMNFMFSSHSSSSNLPISFSLRLLFCQCHSLAMSII